MSTMQAAMKMALMRTMPRTPIGDDSRRERLSSVHKRRERRKSAVLRGANAWLSLCRRLL